MTGGLASRGAIAAVLAIAALLATAPAGMADVPACQPLDAGSAVRGASAITMVNCTDGDGDALAYSVVTPPAHGTVNIDGDGAITYTASDPAYTGDAGFTYGASDGVDSSPPQTVSVTVLNRQPAIGSVTLSPVGPTAGQAITFSAAASDEDNDALAYSWDLDNDGSFDDGTGASVSRAYEVGAYTAGVLVSDGQPTDSTRTQTLQFTVAPAPPPPDTQAPSGSASVVRGQKLGTVLKKGLKARWKLDEASSLKLVLFVSKKTARELGLSKAPKGPVAVGQVSKSVGAAGSGSLTVKLTRKAARALKAVESVKLQLVMTARDAAGNRLVRTVSVTLKR